MTLVASTPTALSDRSRTDRLIVVGSGSGGPHTCRRPDDPETRRAEQSATPTVGVRLLGELQVVRADGSLVDPHAWGTGKTMDLLRILALENGRPVRTNALLDLLWPDVEPSRARASLRTAASRIRCAVGHNCVVRHLDGLMLVTATVDVDEYRTLVLAAQQASAVDAHQEALLLTEAAESLWRGEVHSSNASASWSISARTELHRIRVTALTDATRSALACGQDRQALELASTVIQLDPLRESAHRDLMRAYMQLGEPAQALRAYEELRVRLVDELGIAPSSATRCLHVTILRTGGL